MVLNSASTETRCKMRVRISYDGGVTWPISRKIYDWLTDDEAFAQGKGGYSSMVKTADYTIGALIEINEDTGDSGNSHRSIEFHKFNLPWMVDGATEPIP
jgi:sialidase-1